MRQSLGTMVVLQLIVCNLRAEAAPAAAEPIPPTPEALGRSFMEHLSRGEFAQVETTYNDPIKGWAATTKPLETSWNDANPMSQCRRTSSTEWAS